MFAFAQFEFGFLLGPADGRYLLRDEPGAEPRRVVVLGTLGAPQRRLLGGRRSKAVERAEPEPVPTNRATLIRPLPFGGEAEASAWLDGLRKERGALQAERDAGLRELNQVIRAHRAAAADAFARDVSAEQALVARVGYGRGEQVADGRFAAGMDVPRERPKPSRSERIAPQEQLAAMLGARTEQLACEELVLRARADVDAGRPREAALETRIALETAIAELESSPAGGAPAELAELRGPVGEAANAALRGDPPAELMIAVKGAVELMERALRRHRAAGVQRDFSGP
ncbi:MAG: hypothetical protein WD844_09980 [Thermoleophilaceae bacterium]